MINKMKIYFDEIFKKVNWKINDSLFISTLTSAIMVSILLLPAKNWILIIFLVYLVALFFYNAHGILFVWIMLLPHENILRNNGILNPFYLLFVFCVLYLFLINYNQSKANYHYIYFTFGLLFFSLLPAINIGFQLEQFRALASLSSVLVFFVAIVHFVSQNRNRFMLIVYSMLPTVAIAIIFSFVTAERVRYSLGGNVRSFANILGIAIILLFLWLVEVIKTTTSKRKLFLNKQLYFITFLMVIMSYFLILTLSRGVILAVILAMGSYFVFSILKDLKRKTLIKLILSLIGFSTLIFVIINTSFFQQLGGDRLLYRFRFEFFVNNIRFEFWYYALANLKLLELLFGIGLSNFKDLVSQGGYVYYAHSVFIDLLVSIGLAGVLVFIGYLGHISYKAIKCRNVVSLVLLTYTVFSFSTHGNMFSKYFWFNIALFVGYQMYLQKGKRSELIEDRD